MYRGGVTYYGYRDFAPGMERWMNRDPIGERGGINCYVFVGNGPTDSIDMHGLVVAKSTSYVNSVPATDMAPQPDGTRARGDTTVMVWNFSRGSESCGFLWLKKRFWGYSPKIEVRIRFKTGVLPSTPSSGGYTVGTHEEHHRDIDYQWADKLDAVISGYLGKCMCHSCFYATDTFLSSVDNYYRAYMSYKNKAFDCAVYLPGPNKTAKCNQATEEFAALSTMYTTVVVPAQNNMTAKCP
jgi:uncharacterized protein RhaS with RHS repeats